MNKFYSVLKGAMAVLVHFAHGGLLAVGLMVSVFVGLRVADAGLTPRLIPALPEISLFGAPAVRDDEPDSALPESSAERINPALTTLQRNLVDHISRRHRIAHVAIEQYMTDIYAASAKYKIDPMLLVALISVESAFNPTAESAWGAQGLTQVIPRFHTEKIASFGADASLLDPKVSIYVGAQVLREYIRAAGSVEAGLQRYVGSIEDPDQIYSTKVLSELKRLQSIFSPRSQSAGASS